MNHDHHHNNNRIAASTNGTRTNGAATGSGTTFGRLARLGVAVGALAVIGAACTGGTDDTSGELGNVDEVVLRETVNDDGSVERLSVTVGSPASLDLDGLEVDVDVVAPWEVGTTDSCVAMWLPDPVAEIGRGVATQGGAHLAYIVADFADDETAHDAQTSNVCYHDAAGRLAAELGRTPAPVSLESHQEFGLAGDTQTEFRISPPWFDDDLPTVFTGRHGATVAVLVDLDNALDEFDGPNLALELAAGG